MGMAMTILGAATLAKALMDLIEAMDKPKKNEPQRCGNNVRARYGR